MSDQNEKMQETLERLYDETIEHHEEYLDKLHKAFDHRCDEIGAKAKQKLAKLDPNDEEAKQPILQEQQEQLNKTLGELKYAITKSNANAMKRLEAIQEKLESSMIDIEEELANL